VLCQPVLELILALSANELQHLLPVMDGAAYLVQSLYIFDMIVNNKFEFVRHSASGCTSSARTRNQRHVVRGAQCDSCQRFDRARVVNISFLY